jgi:hypothetical protein
VLKRFITITPEMVPVMILKQKMTAVLAVPVKFKPKGYC